MPHSLHGKKILSLMTLITMDLMAMLCINERHEMTLRMTTLGIIDLDATLSKSAMYHNDTWYNDKK